MKLLARLILFLFIAAALPGQSRTQEPSTGSIKGTILDNSKAVVPGVQVTLTDAAGKKQTSTSNEIGEFEFPGLVPGVYAVSVVLQGFKDFVATGLDVTAGAATRIEVTLVTASVSTQVNVEGQSVTQVEQENAQITGTITSKEITIIGLNGRNFSKLVALAPGVSDQSGQDEALVGLKGSVKYSVNGGRVEYNTYDVDGGDILNTSVNGNSSMLMVYPSIDAIDQLQVLTSSYGAMYGRSASGTILSTTKSGGADFHGDGYFFLRNEMLNARNFFDETNRAPLYRKYDPGFTIGGPLYIPGHYNTNKDKTFFFFSEEYRHEQEPVEFNQGVPSLQERDCSKAANVNPYCLNPNPQFGTTVFGDFSDMCPSTGPGLAGSSAGGTAVFSRIPGQKNYYPDCPSPLGGGTGTPGQFRTFAGNLVPIDPRSAAYLSTGLIPLPTSSTGCNSTIKSCYDATISPLTIWREELIRIDHNLTAKHKLYFRYIHDSYNTVVATPQWAVIHNSFPTVESNLTGPGLSMVAHWTSTVSTHFVNDLAMAYTTDHIKISAIPGPGVSTLTPPANISAAPCLGVNQASCGIGYIFDNNKGGKIPGIEIGGTNAAYGGNGFNVDTGYMPWHHSNPDYSPRDDATYALYNHTLEFGVLAIFAQRNEVNPPVGANSGDVQGVATFSNQLNPASSGNSFADFLTPAIVSYQQDSAQGVYHNNYTVIEPYFQDDWKVTRRLTLNLGFRLSMFGLYKEKNNYSYNWVPSQFSSALASQVSISPLSGELLLNSSTGISQAVPLNLNNVDPHLLNGVVQCGVGEYANGTKVPAGCMTNHYLNPAPRVGFAWDPFGNSKTSVRAGYGIFFEHGTGNEANTGSLEGSPGNSSAGGVLDMTQYYPSSWNCIGNVVAGCSISGPGAFPLNLTAIPTRVNWPYVQQWSFSVQRELPWNLLGTIAYVGSKGTHLTTELQLNQLEPLNASQNPFAPGQPLTTAICNSPGNAVIGSMGTFTIQQSPTLVQVAPGQPGYANLVAACAGVLGPPEYPVPSALRQAPEAIAPGIGQIFSLESMAKSSYNALQITLRRTKGPVTLGVSYSYSHSIDDSSDRTSTVFVNAYDLNQNRASSDFDQRHILNMSYIYEIPLMKWYSHLDDFLNEDSTNQVRNPNAGKYEGRMKTFLEGWELSGVTVYQTGTPFSVLNGGSANGITLPDNAGVLAINGPGSYPDIAVNPGKVTGSTSTLQTFGPLLRNPNEFVAPTGLTYGDAGRNYLNNPSRLNFDIALIKYWAFNEKRSMQFRLETFNTFNHTQFRIYDPSNPGNTGNNVISCYAGTNNSAGDPSCVAGSSFLHPIDAHRPRTMQLGMKYFF